jgi:hypothetical protein
MQDNKNKNEKWREKQRRAVLQVNPIVGRLCQVIMHFGNSVYTRAEKKTHGKCQEREREREREREEEEERERKREREREREREVMR